VIEQVGDGQRVAGAGSALGPVLANTWRGPECGTVVGSAFGGILALARGLCIALVCTTLVTTAVAQERRRHGPLFKPEALGELEGPDRDAWQMPDAVMDALRIADGSHVADIGAGGGWFTVRLARRVGPNGLVYAEDVQSQMLEAIRRRVDREGLRNVRTVRGIETDPRLPPQSIEAALIVDAYHEFGDPVAMLRGIAAALKPGGSLGVVNFNKSGGGPGPPSDERVDATLVIQHASSAGLTLRRQETFLPFQYFLVFGRADDPSGASTTAQTR
jgi:ubiquinone/menaquinone biosynthesis C-methylase UbiE